MAAPRSHREEQAERDVATTVVAPATAAALAVGFIATIVGVPALHLASSQRTPLLEAGAAIARAPLHPGPEGRNASTLARLDAFEDELRDHNPLAEAVRPLVQRARTSALMAGNAQVFVGDDEWLYFQPSLRFLYGPGFLDTAQLRRRSLDHNAWAPPPHPDPRPAIHAFREDLLQLGIELLVVPIPAKPTIDPAGLDLEPGVTNASWRAMMLDLERYEVPTLDPTELLSALTPPRYLRTDTHWRPEAMEAVAGGIATHLRGLGVPATRRKRAKPEQRTGSGDLVELLGAGPDIVRPDRVQVRPAPAAPTRGAHVLLLGDSFANIYSDPTLGFGADAGLGPTLARHLGAPVDWIIRNAGGASEGRRVLQDDPERLDETLVVVWTFAARELAFGDWLTTPLEPGETPGTELYVRVEPGAILELSGTVAAVSELPEPRTAPYADHLISIQLRDVDAPGAREAWVYAWSMQDRVLTDHARLTPGTRVQLRVQPFGEGPPRAHTASRSDLRARPGGAPLLWLVERQ